MVRNFADFAQDLLRLQAIRAGLLASEGNLLFQAGHADLEKLIKVAGENQQELEAFKQWIGFIQCLLQHADVELQLRQLPVDIQLRCVGVSQRRSFHWLLADGCRTRQQLDFGCYLDVAGCRFGLAVVAAAVELWHGGLVQFGCRSRNWRAAVLAK